MEDDQKLKIEEDKKNQNGIQPKNSKWKTTNKFEMEYGPKNPNERQKKIRMEYNQKIQYGRRPINLKWKMAQKIKMKDDKKLQN